MKDAKINSAPMLAACDDGYAETKVALEDGRCLRFASLVRSGGVLGVPNDEVHSYETADGFGSPAVYTATGDFDIDAANTRFDNYPFSPENRVMIHHALRRSGLGGQRVSLATSLPVQDYFDGNSVAMRTIEAKSANVMGAVRSVSGSVCAEVISSKVYAEGVSAWVDFALDDKGNYRCVLKRAAAVIDIGGRTTDTVKILKQMTVEKANSGTCLVGVLSLYDELAQVIARHPEVIAAFPRLKVSSIARSTIAEVLSTHRFKEFGLDIDLSAEVKAAKANVANKILRDVESRISSGFDLERLLFVGGGASVLQDEIKARYKQAEFVAEPEFSNARGMLKIMKFT